MLETTTQLNTPGAVLAEMDGVHALTDVTGFGLLGHLLEICLGSNLGAAVDWSRLPVLDSARELARQGFATGASERNWASYGNDVVLAEGMPEWQKNLLTDPQTSGGLLVACDPGMSEQVLALFRREGFGSAARIGAMVRGEPKARVA